MKRNQSFLSRFLQDYYYYYFSAVLRLRYFVYPFPAYIKDSINSGNILNENDPSSELTRGDR